jgi:hypothetical protein
VACKKTLRFSKELGLQRRVRSGFTPDSLFVSNAENRHIWFFVSRFRVKSQMFKKAGQGFVKVVGSVVMSSANAG